MGDFGGACVLLACGTPRAAGFVGFSLALASIGVLLLGSGGGGVVPFAGRLFVVDAVLRLFFFGGILPLFSPCLLFQTCCVKGERCLLPFDSQAPVSSENHDVVIRSQLQ